jgi:hypothetical protein
VWLYCIVLCCVVAASWYASLFPEVAGKQCVVYKAVMEQSEDDFSEWLASSTAKHGNVAFNLVGGASSSVTYAGNRIQKCSGEDALIS